MNLLPEKCLTYLKSHKHRKSAKMLMSILFGIGVLGLETDFITEKMLTRLNQSSFKLLDKYAKKQKMEGWKVKRKSWRKKVRKNGDLLKKAK
jgi:hypothetical protein